MRLGVLAVASHENGGSFQYTRSTLEALARQPRLETTIYAPRGNPHYEDLGLPVRRIAMGRTRQLANALLEPALRYAADPFASEEAVLAPVYSPLLLRTRKPFVYTLHDLQELHYPEYFSRAQRLWRHHIHKRLTARAARIICESRWVRADVVASLGVSSERVAVIVAPPMLRRAPSFDADAVGGVRKRHRLPATFAFYPAQFWPHKNHLRLVEAFRRVADRLPEAHLVLTGKKRDAFDEVFARIGELGLTERVMHLGYVDDEDLPALYRSARMLVMPSLFESVSIPVYEAFQAGTAVAASNVVALPEQVGDAGLLFDPRDIGAIADAMTVLFTDDARQRELGERGARRIAAMTHERYGEALVRLLELVAPGDLPS